MDVILETNNDKDEYYMEVWDEKRKKWIFRTNWEGKIRIKKAKN